MLWRRIVVKKGNPKDATLPNKASLGAVGWNGRTPKCAGCNQKTDRGSQRLLLRRSTNKVKGWSTETSFHLGVDCIRAINWANQIQARSLIEPSPNPTSSDQSSKIERKQARRRAVVRELSTSLGPTWTQSLPPRSGRGAHSN